MQNVSEALVGVTGAIKSFDLDETVEYGVNGALPASTIDHGFANEDGITITGERSVTNIYAWQNATMVRSVVTEASVTYSFVAIQTNDDNAELYYGRAKNATTGATHWDAANLGKRRSFVFDIIDTSLGKKIRHYVPIGEVTEIGEQQITSSGLIGYSYTIVAYKTDIEGESANTLIWSGDLDEDSNSGSGSENGEESED